MYELDYVPEKLDWNVYFARYRENGEIKYYNEFLHFYEPVLERKARRFIAKYELEENRIDDLKQIFSALLWEELQSYDSELPLLQLIKFKVLDAWREYVRINCGNYQPKSKHQYLLLRKTALLYYRKNNDEKTPAEIISEIAEELKLTENVVSKYLNAAMPFQPKYNADFYCEDDDGEYYAPIAGNLSTEDLFFKTDRQKKLLKALERMMPTTRRLIEYVYGICPDCLGDKGKMTIGEAALRLDLTESGAEKKLKRALKSLREKLQE